MRHRRHGSLITGVVLLLVLAAWGVPTAATQDDTADEQSTVVADLQTRVAALETQQAQGTDGTSSTAVAADDLVPPIMLPDGSVAGTPAADDTAAPADGELLFEANAQTGFANWTDGYFGGFSNPFSVRDGMLVSEAGGYTILFAPYLTTTPDYIVEAEIRLTPPGPGTPETAGAWTIAGVGARLGDWSAGDRSGYTATTSGSSARIETDVINTLDSLGDLPGAGLPDVSEGWHVYRFELRDDQLRFLIDGVLILEVTDAQFSGVGADGRVGVVASLGPIEVRSFRVLAWA